MKEQAAGHANVGDAYRAAVRIWEAAPLASRLVAHSEYTWLMELQAQANANPAAVYGPGQQANEAQGEDAAATQDQEASATLASAAEVRFERKGVEVRGVTLQDDGALQFRVRTALRPGSVVTLQTREWNEARKRWVTVEDQLQVRRGGMVQASTQVFAYNTVLLKDARGRTLARITTTT